MLELKSVRKEYISGDETVHALKGINLSFRNSEFVSVLGPSGCGKTTMLNIIGGLDQYTSGDLVINGKSTKSYKDKDWDVYRNHSIGFVFQSYNLIPHQTVLANVELSLTLSGVSKEERRKRAKQVLEKVGLKSQMHKKPGQMSGGQMQRVAIARALINDPDILLADEPTGALDSETSVQVMELLKEISKEKLVIMVTHNPDLAGRYSTRIIKLLDGEVTGDSDPFDGNDTPKESQIKKGEKTSMSFKTALSLSLNNLVTKKGRTILTAFAGSIGIIGIALILSFSNGVRTYIDNVQEDTLSGYPISIEKTSVDAMGIMEAMQGMTKETESDDGVVRSTPVINDMIETFTDKREENNLKKFKKYLEQRKDDLDELTTDIQYDYGFDVNIYNEKGEGGIVKANPSELLSELGFGQMEEMQSMMGGSSAGSSSVFSPIVGDEELLNAQYDMLEGRWPEKYDEAVILLDKNGNISDYTLYTLGLMDQQELIDNYNALLDGKEIKEAEQKSYKYSDLLNIKFKLILNTDFYKKENGIWIDKSDNEKFMEKVCRKSADIKIVGIVKPSQESIGNEHRGGVLYENGLQKYIMDSVKESKVVKEQKKNKKINVFTGMEFSDESEIDPDKLSDEQKMQLASMSEKELAEFMQIYSDNANATYDDNLRLLGYVDENDPSCINIYAKDFDSKDAVAQIIDEYNDIQTDKGREGNVITYSDVVGTMMNSVTAIIDIISYVLIAFVSVSLIVSSIMIGIITYISVLERTKEIGILRAVGASKRDISRVFNAETFIVGSLAGILGIAVTLIINIPVNIFLGGALGISAVANLPAVPAVVLIVLSILLTVIAGIIPSRLAAKKDPVVALRTE